MKKQVSIVSSSGVQMTGEVTLMEESPANEDQVRIFLEFNGQAFTFDADNFFEALTTLRVQLEALGFRPRCFGACENVFPSPMIRSMGVGDQAYRLELGRPAGNADLVNIFETAIDSEPVSVEAQEEFYHKWLNSLN